MDEGCRALRSDAAGWVLRLRGYERLLGQAMSLRGIDICWREAQACKVGAAVWIRLRVLWALSSLRILSGMPNT